VVQGRRTLYILPDVRKQVYNHEMAAALEGNATLRGLHLEMDSIRDAGTQALAESLKTNTTLVKLILCNNKIRDDGAQALAAALRTNTILRTRAPKVIPRRSESTPRWPARWFGGHFQV